MIVRTITLIQVCNVCWLPSAAEITCDVADDVARTMRGQLLLLKHETVSHHVPCIVKEAAEDEMSDLVLHRCLNSNSNAHTAIGYTACCTGMHSARWHCNHAREAQKRA
jgi:hypothetical protein